jgi:hypothetical protein
MDMATNDQDVKTDNLGASDFCAYPEFKFNLDMLREV